MFYHIDILNWKNPDMGHLVGTLTLLIRNLGPEEVVICWTIGGVSARTNVF